jgi:hypothetical protein
MPNLFMHRLAALLIFTCLPLSGSAQAERWYQVELLIFSHEGTVTNEQWEPLPQLTYPAAGRFLVFPAANEARLAEYQAEARALTAAAEEDIEFVVEDEVDEFGRQLIHIFPRDLEQAPDIPPALTDTEEGSEDSAQESEEELLPLVPTPFIALPGSSREFRGKAAYMQRTGNYRTLFHETWAQPVRGEQQALPLIIDRSGDSESWPQLQGSVKLHLSRYLHIQTRLWLNTQGDYLPGEWRMPPPPFGPASVIIEAPEPEPEEEAYYVNPEPAVPLEPATEQELAEPEGPVYPWRHAVLVAQTRKMRSNEVHYIDHPLLGVVVKLTPLDAEQLQIMAEAEQRALLSGIPTTIHETPQQETYH